MTDDEFRYASALAFGAAITNRIKTLSAGSPYNASQLRKQFAYDRLLARIFSDPASGWILKGGISMIARVPAARHTADIDLSHSAGNPAAALNALRIAVGRDLGDFFTFRLDPPRSLVQGVEGIRIAVQSQLGPRPFERFGVDLVTGTVATGSPDRARPIGDLGFPGLPRPDYMLYPVADTLADKVAATVELHAGRPSTRFRDLVDIVLIAHHETVSASALSTALDSEQRRRNLTLPLTFDVPERPMWQHGYSTAARTVPGLAEQDLDSALATVRRLLDPVLTGTWTTGLWNPRHRQWAAGSP